LNFSAEKDAHKYGGKKQQSEFSKLFAKEKK